MQIDKKLLKHHLSIVLFITIITIVCWKIYLTEIPILKIAEYKLSDLRRKYFYKDKTSTIRKQIIIIDIEEESLQHLGAWAWPRKIHSQVIKFLWEAKAKVIGFDILFCEPDISNPESDKIFAKSLKNKPIILGDMFSVEDSKNIGDIQIKYWGIPSSLSLDIPEVNSVYAPLKLFCDALKPCGWVGHIEMGPDLDGVFRRRIALRKMKNFYYIGFDVAAGLLYFGLQKRDIELSKNYITLNKNNSKIKIPIDEKGRMLLRYYGGSYTFEYIPYYKLIYVYRYLHKIISVNRLIDTVFSIFLDILPEKIKKQLDNETKNQLYLFIKTSLLQNLNPYIKFAEIQNVLKKDIIKKILSTLILSYKELFDEKPQLSSIILEKKLHDLLVYPLKVYVFGNIKNVNKQIKKFCNKFKNKIVLIGSSASQLHDQRLTPFSSETPGVEIVATGIANIINQDFIRYFSSHSYLRLLIFGAIFIYTITLFRFYLSLLIFIIGILSYNVWTCWMYYAHNVLVNMLIFNLEIIFQFCGIILIKYLYERKEKAKVQELFGRFVNPTLLKNIIEDPSILKLGGELREMSVVFCGYKNFSLITNKLTPEEVIEILQESHTIMSENILKHKGTIDKFEGDIIMAFWGAPVWFEDHAIKGCEAILKNIKKLQELNKKWKSKYGIEFSMEIGFNSGQMVVGNIGSHKRFDYSIIGDTVNTAARVKGANKIYNTSFLITEFTYEKIKNTMFITRFIDNIIFVGKTEPLGVYEIICFKEEMDKNIKDLLHHFNIGYSYYLNQEWQKAEEIFDYLIKQYNDGPSKTFFYRCIEYSKNPPASWDGNYKMKTK